MDRERAARAVEDYGDMVLRLAFQRLKNQADAEDVGQNVFVILMRQGDFTDEDHLKHWLIRVTIQQCENLRHSAWRRKVVALSEAWPVFAPEEREAMEELWSLPPKDRDVIYLHYYEGYKLRELSELLGENINALSARLQRARKKLKLLIEEGERDG